MTNIVEKLNLIKRNTEEILTDEELVELLRVKKEPVVYVGYAPTGKPHIGYIISAMKIRDFVKAGLKVKILLADIHAMLDNLKTPIDLMEARVQYYKAILSELYKALGIKLSKIKFVRGSDFQLKKKYIMDVYKLSALMSVERCKHAASEVVKFGENPKLSGFLYPLLQALDEEYLKVDIQYGGLDQRKILGFARESHPKLGQKKRVAIMSALLPSLSGSDKMGASESESSKIDLLDSEEEIISKINKAYCPEGDVENAIMKLMKYVIMVLKEDNKEIFLVKRREEFGGNVEYKSYAELEADFIAKKLHPQDLKEALADELVKILRGLNKSKLLVLQKKAYPE